jgi:hypothetical protein
MAKGEYLGTGVVASVGVGTFTGRQLQGLFLVEYDESSDSYTGISFPQNTEFSQFFHNLGKGQFGADRPINVGVAVRISGLRKYPCTDRPDYAFQFVLPGEDPAPLRAIMAANAEGHYTTAPVEQVVEEAVPAEPQQQQQQSDSRPTWMQMGFNSKAEWRAAGSPSK